MKKILLSFVFVLLFFESGWLLQAQNAADSPQIRADNQIIREDFLRAYGNVEIVWQDYVIYADVVEFNQKSKELFAEGRVTISGKDSVLSGEKLKFNLKTKSGELFDTYGLMSPFVKYESDKLTQVDMQTLTFQRLDFSSCSQINPRWKISGRKGKIKKDKYIEMKDALFRIKNIPVFYLPYLRYPIKKDGRSTGFLIPAPGTSTQRGFFVKLSFYWDIRPNIDLTVNLDHYQYLGLGLSEELRYLFRHANGNIRFFNLFPGLGVQANDQNPIKEEDIERLKRNGKNFVLDMNHQQDIQFLHSHLSIESRLPGAPEVLRYLDNGYERYNLMHFKSALSWTSQLSIFTLNLSASRKHTFNIKSKKSEKEDSLPSLALNMQPQKLGLIPGQFNFSLSYDRDIRRGEAQTAQPKFVYGQASQKICFDPAYALDLIKTPWLKSSLAVSARNSFYARSLDPLTGKIIDKPVTMQYQTAQLNLRGPIFSRVFVGSRRSFRHLIEPNFSFLYATKAKNRERIILVNDRDFSQSSTATFSLVSRLLMKKQGLTDELRELLLFKIEQSYFLDPETANQGQQINGKYPTFSDISTSLAFNPGKYFSIGTQLSYNFYQISSFQRFDKINFNINYSKPDAPLNGKFYYNKYCYKYGPKDDPSVQSLIGGDISLNIRGLPFYMTARAEYDFIRKTLTGCTLKATLDYQCLTINVNLSFYLLNEKLAHELTIMPGLGNFGTGTPFFND